MDVNEAGRMADEMIAGEVARQDKMWGAANERTDSSKGQLFHAGLAQQMALLNKQNGDPAAFAIPPHIYPADWGGFRDYGSDVANLVVAAAFIRQEIKRKIAAGEDTTRTSRNPVTQAYPGDQPNTYTA